MKIQDATQVKVGEYDYYIRPFSAFKAANISGDVIQVCMPMLGAIMPFIDTSKESSALDTDVSAITPAITQGFESLSGDKCEQLLRKLLIKEKNVAVDYEGETVPLTEDLSNEVFCGEVQDMYILAFHVIKVNYGGFFKRLGNQSGSVAELSKKIMK